MGKVLMMTPRVVTPRLDRRTAEMHEAAEVAVFALETLRTRTAQVGHPLAADAAAAFALVRELHADVQRYGGDAA